MFPPRHLSSHPFCAPQFSQCTSGTPFFLIHRSHQLHTCHPSSFAAGAQGGRGRSFEVFTQAPSSPLKPNRDLVGLGKGLWGPNEWEAAHGVSHEVGRPLESWGRVTCACASLPRTSKTSRASLNDPHICLMSHWGGARMGGLMLLLSPSSHENIMAKLHYFKDYLYTSYFTRQD